MTQPELNWKASLLCASSVEVTLDVHPRFVKPKFGVSVPTVNMKDGSLPLFVMDAFRFEAMRW